MKHVFKFTLHIQNRCSLPPIFFSLLACGCPPPPITSLNRSPRCTWVLCLDDDVRCTWPGVVEGRLCAFKLSLQIDKIRNSRIRVFFLFLKLRKKMCNNGARKGVSRATLITHEIPRYEKFFDSLIFYFSYCSKIFAKYKLSLIYNIKKIYSLYMSCTYMYMMNFL